MTKARFLALAHLHLLLLLPTFCCNVFLLLQRDRAHFSFAVTVLFWLFISSLYLCHSSNFQSIYMVRNCAAVDFFVLSFSISYLYACAFIVALENKNLHFMVLKSRCQRTRQINTIQAENEKNLSISIRYNRQNANI